MALDRVSTDAMLADPASRIIYLNDAVQTLFRSRAADPRSRVPEFADTPAQSPDALNLRFKVARPFDPPREERSP